MSWFCSPAPAEMGRQEVRAESFVMPPHTPVSSGWDMWGIVPWNLLPNFVVLSKFEDKVVGLSTRVGWIRGALSQRDEAKLRGISDEDFFYWMASNVVQSPLIFVEMYRRQGERDEAVAALQAALSRAEKVEQDARQFKTDAELLVDAVNVVKNTLKATVDELAVEKGRVETCEKDLKRERETTAGLREEVVSLHGDNNILNQHLGEAERAARKYEEEITTLKSQVAASKKDNEGYQLQFKERDAKISDMNSIIKNNRFQRQELQKSLTKENVYYVENFMRTQNFEDAVGEIVWDWYEAGFEVVKRQVEAPIEAGESSVSWDSDNNMGFKLPETVGFPTQYLPQHPLDEKSPIDLLKELEVVAGDDLDVQSDSAPPPTEHQ